MSRLFDYDPATGMAQYFDYDPLRDEIHIRHEQDVSVILDQIKEKRLSAKAFGTVETFAHYATIPAIVELELRRKGINLLDRNATKAIAKEIEANYPYLKTTEKKLIRHS